MSGMDLLGSLGAVPAPEAQGPAEAPSADGALPCSRRGCSAPAQWALRWNNPRIHDPARRKTWLACQEHRRHLDDFLSERGFLRETIPVGELPGQEDTR